MKTTFGKILKTIGIFIASVFMMLVLAILGFAIVPELIIPKSLITKAVSFAPESAKLTYDKIEIRFVKESLNRKRFQVSLTNVCIDYKEKAVDTCFDELSAGFTFSLFLPNIVSVQPLRLINAQATIDADRLSDGSPKAKSKSKFNIVDFLRKQILPKWNFPGTIVEVKRFELISGNKKFVTSLFINGLSDGSTDKSTALQFKIPDFRELNSGFPRGRFNYTLHWPTDALSQYQSVGEIKIELAAKQAVALNFETKSVSWDDIAYDLKAKINGIAPLNSVELDGKYTPQNSNGLLSLKLGGPQSEVKQLNFLNCTYNVDLSQKLGGLKCGPQQVSLALKERPTFKGKPALFKLAPTFELKISNFAYDNGAKANIELNLSLQHLDFISAKINAIGSFDASNRKFKYDAKTNSNIRINDFKKLVAFLSDTPVSIPAPINVMGGVVTLDIDGQVNEENGKINFAFKPDLSSQYQRLLLTVGGKVELEKQKNGLASKLTLSTNLQDVKLSMPRVELKAPPQLARDKRFRLAEKRVKDEKAKEVSPRSGSTFAYDVDVKTPRVGAIAVATNLTKNAIPIGVNINATSEHGIGPGTIEFGKVAIELFRRKAFLDHLTVDLKPNGDKFVNGLFSINYLDYDITIKVEGAVETPKIVMESEPALSQDQIISVLLFGKAPDELDETQRSSVGNVSSAIADAALSFSSLYFLASTPVESIGYDAQRGVVTAKVGLGKGTSLELGSSGQDLAEVGVRRRLGQNWYLNSYVDKDQHTDERTVAAFIEWVKRF